MFLMKILGVIAGVLLCGAGFRFMSMPVTTMSAITSVLPILLGIVMTANGAVRFVRWTQLKSAGRADGLLFWEAILGVIFGVLLLGSWLMQSAMASAFDILMAVWASMLLLTSGATRIARALQMKKANETLTEFFGIAFNWVLELILGILILVVGVVSIFNPVATIASLGMIFGIDVLFYGVTMVVSSIVLF